MYKSIYYIIFVLFVCSAATAQTVGKPASDTAPSNIIQKNDALGMCGVDVSMARLRHDPAYKAKESKMNRDILSFQRNLSDDSIFLPVVFHIINQAPWEVPDQLLLKALQQLNDAFSKRGYYAGSKGADTKIRFCLAKKDPDGGTTSGITRTKSFFSTHLNPLIEDARLKKLIQWDPTRYINIWYISGMDMESFAEFECGKWIRNSISGYATMPPGGTDLDGIVLTGFDVPMIHEMGHYLGLYHTFEGRNCSNNDCTTDGDRVCDTPPEYSLSASSCSDPENSCGTDTLSNYSNGNFTTDVPDQIANFMDYGNEACQNEFTQGQADRMIATIQTQRAGLLQNECDKPCNENIIADFIRANPYPLPGDLVSFANKSSGAAHYQWLVNDAVVSANTDFSYNFPSTGKYKVTLKAYNTTSCYALYSDFVTVNCGVTARFYADKRTIASKLPIYPDSIYFTNTSENATSFRWMMSNDSSMTEQLISTKRDLVYLFPSPANYSLRLIATNGACTDTTEIFTMPVLDPTPDGVASLNAVDCFEQTKVKVSFSFCNVGYATIPPNIPVSFYDEDPRAGNAHKLGTTFSLPDSIPGKCCGVIYTQIIDVNRPGLNVLYMVFNDSGNTVPFRLPNTSFLETNYSNNIAMVTNFRFKAAIVPAQATLEPGDTLQLTGQAGPGAIASYKWSTAHNLSCTGCSSPYLVADSDRIKKMIAVSKLGCVDSAFTTIKVPPANDYTIDIGDMQCAAGNKLYVDFTLHNNFKRGVIPKGLTVSFYKGDPATDTARLLPPVFSVPDTIFAQEGAFNSLIKGVENGKVYAVVNDSGTAIPVLLPNNRLLPEKDYSNNGAEFLYHPETVQLQPTDTTLFRKSSFPIKINTVVSNAFSVAWYNGNGYTLNCNQCISPNVTVFDDGVVNMQMENKYGCLIKGTSNVKIFPPDMTVKILETNCYSNSTTLVSFSICMNNNYDSVFAGVPVSFYDAPPASGTANLLSPVFYTTQVRPGSCYIYQHIISTPATGHLYAVVNDKGGSNGGTPDKVFNETDYGNNTGDSSIVNFTIRINPSDTTIARSGTVQLTPLVSGGTLSSFLWKQDPFLSCINCLAPFVTPMYTKEFAFVAQNEYHCVDTAYAVVKIFTGGSVNIPSAFSPNHDGLNDIFYVLGGAGINVVKNFIIFNRWGQKVFEANNILPNDPRYGWDGTQNGIEAAPGAYVYLIRLPGTDGKDQVYKGTIMLLR